MKKRMRCFLVATLQIVTWYSVTSRPFAPPPHVIAPQQVKTDQNPHFPGAAFDSKQGLKGVEAGVVYGEEKTQGSLSRLGSRPPSCEHKCEGCIPCNAIQIPTTTDNIGVQYANYEPEGWKCKCGTAFFNP